MILYKVGPGKWLSFQLFLFGIVSTFQAWQTNYASYLVTRFLLGVTESGYIPGGLWTLSTWYTRSETAKRVMIFFFGNQLGQASAKLIAYGILHMRGVGGKPGWFWLFVIMGAFTIVSGIILGLLLPDSISNPRSWFLPNVRIFTERELNILRNRIIIDDPEKGKTARHIGRSAFRQTVSLVYDVVAHTSFPIGGSGFTSSSLSPTMGRSAVSIPTGRPSSKASDTQLCRQTRWRPSGYFCKYRSPSVSVGFQIVCKCLQSFAAHRTHRSNRRGETVMAGLTMHMFGYVLNLAFAQLNNRGVKFFGVVWTQTFANLPHPLNIAWLSLVCRNSEERSLAMAM